MSKAKKIVVCVFIVCFLFCGGITVFGAQTINVKMAQPQVNDTLSYVEIYCDKPNGGYNTIFGLWVIKSSNDTFVPVVTLSGNTIVVNSNSALFGYYSDLPYNTWYTVSGSGSTNSSNQGELRFVINSDYSIVKYVRVYGSIRNQTGKTTGDYTINYGSDVSIINMLGTIVSLIQQQNTNTQNIIAGADQNASDIQSNDDKNTQSIIDNQNQLAEQEKTETQNSGNDSVNDVSGSVPDKSAGMLSALQSLSDAVSYTGTSANWTFPRMYIPAMTGITDRINLNSPIRIDFTYWVNKIPQNIRTIVSALATIGLVVFAFKELYGLISYVLTLKGGGNNE